MERARLINELYELSTQFMIEFDTNEGWIIVKNVPTPDNWTPEHIDLRLEVDDYPTHPPAVYVPEELRLDGERPTIMMPPRIDDNSDWSRLDLGIGGDYGMEWEAKSHTVHTAVRGAFHMLNSCSDD